MADVTKEPKKIKPQIIIACAVAAAVVIGVAAFLIIRYNSNLLANTVRFLRMQGEVTLLDSKDKEVSIQESMRLSAGNKVITASESFAALGLDDFKIVSLDESTKTGINKKGKKLEIDLQSGGLYFNVTKALEDDEEFNIRTATMITGIRGTCGYISANELYLLEGHVVTTNNFGESIEVEAGQKLVVDAATGKMRIEKYTLYDLPLLVISELARDDVRRAQVLEILGISEDEFWAYAWGLEPAYFDWADLGRERPEEPEEEPEPEVVEEPEEEPAEEPEESKTEEPEEEEPAEEEPEEEPEEEKPVEKTYTITVTASEGGTISASASSAKEGEVISLKAVADGGKEIARWEPDGNVTLDFSNGLDSPTFVMPATNVSVHVAYGWATSQNKPTYSISVASTDTTKGTVSVSPASAKEGDTVTLTATPINTFYRLKAWNVLRGGVSISNSNTFTMPAGDVDISAEFGIDPSKYGYFFEYDPNNSIAKTYLSEGGSVGNLNLSDSMYLESMGSDHTVNLPTTLYEEDGTATQYSYHYFFLYPRGQQGATSVLTPGVTNVINYSLNNGSATVEISGPIDQDTTINLIGANTNTWKSMVSFFGCRNNPQGGKNIKVTDGKRTFVYEYFTSSNSNNTGYGWVYTDPAGAKYKFITSQGGTVQNPGNWLILDGPPTAAGPADYYFSETDTGDYPTAGTP